MAYEPRLRPGQRIPPWTLIDFLGRGGNAEVWTAQADSLDGPVALKVLNARGPQREPYLRFRNEIAFHQSKTLPHGILPVLAYSLPDQPSRENPAWLAMPVAVPLRDHLGEEPDLVAVVGAIADIATALAELVTRGVAHRDVKPANMYWHEERAAIGDFGLVELPDQEPLTAPGKPLGPQHFLAPEMIRTPETAVGGPADVYSLAKTLWVLTTGQTFPPPGEIRRDTDQVRLRSYVSHPRVHLLEALIERTTSFDPAARPSMSEVAAELAAWLNAPAEPVAPADLADLGARFVAATAPQRRVAEIHMQHRCDAEGALYQIEQTIDGLADRIKESGIGDDRVDWTFDRPAPLLPRPLTFGSRERLWAEAHCIEILGSETNGVENRLYVGVLVDLFDGGTMEITVGYWLIERIGQQMVGIDELWRDDGSAPAGSALAEQLVARLRTGLLDNLESAFAQLVGRAEE